nr:uncharacterized protein LOC106689162 isoform X1 [Halyomorpha halys]
MSGALLFRVSIPADKPLEQALKDVLAELKIKNPIWLQGSEDGIKYTFRQVLFYLENGPETEEAIKLLTEKQIGIRPHSSIGLFQCYLLYEGTKEQSPRIKIFQHEDEFSTWDRFVESVRPRLAIAQVAETVKYKASLRFDFLVLLIVAGLTASLGLVEDNQLILAASMLISPLMNPMVAATFGTVISDCRLQKLGIVNGLLGLFLCLIIGFIYGIINAFIQGNLPRIQWPTGLMYSMGTVSSLWTGIMLALLSGVAVSIGILGDEPTSIHGVAMSAALLPPAVNAGLLWSNSAIHLRTTTFPPGFQKIWSSNPPLEFAVLGAMSLSLSFLNILFIFIAGIVLLKVKEAAPWRKKGDIRWERLKDYRPLTKEETETISHRIGKQLQRMNQEWTVPSSILSQKIPSELVTWYANKKDLIRPTAEDMTKLMTPRSHWSNIPIPGHHEINTIGPGTSHNKYTSQTQTPQKSRFTVVPVSL